MQPEVRERLRHVIEAGETIVRATTAKPFGDYAADRTLKYAVERAFTIIGEALRETLKAQPDLATRITGHRRIIDFRNVLVHDYATVYDEGVWRIIEQHYLSYSLKSKRFWHPKIRSTCSARIDAKRDTASSHRRHHRQ